MIRTIRKFDDSIKQYIHILIRKDGKYAVFTNGLKPIKVFGNYKEAVSFCKKMQKQSRLPILVHNNSGIVVDVMSPTVKGISITDTSKRRPRGVRMIPSQSRTTSRPRGIK